MNKLFKSWTIIRSGSSIRVLVFIVIISGLFIADSCIYPYNPSIDEFQNLLVIDGHIVKGEKTQVVRISRSSPFNNPEPLPVSGCKVNVVDDKGKSFGFNETVKGTYAATIPDDQLKYNTSYKLFVITPDNQNYESSSEMLLPGNPVDSVYYIEESGQSAATGRMSGIQFYVDLKVPGGNTHHFRWVMEETWEYHRKYPIEVQWNGTRKVTLPPNSDSLRICYITLPVTGFYSTSTTNLVVNEKKKIPLNFVSNQSNRLEVKYSLLVRQYSLSESAYKYFNTKKIETQESGGLYQSQPGQSFSNIVNADKSDEKVLGYFWASAVSERRIFAVPPFKFAIEPYCFASVVNWSNMLALRGKIFYITTINGVEHTAAEMCFNCTKGGGITSKPGFWK